jgi:hypothetical protein
MCKMYFPLIKLIYTKEKQIICIVLAHCSNSPRVDICLRSDILFWFRANQPLLLLFSDVYLADKLRIPILVFGSNRLGIWKHDVLDYIIITFQFSWLNYITITSILKCNLLGMQAFLYYWLHMCFVLNLVISNISRLYITNVFI